MLFDELSVNDVNKIKYYIQQYASIHRISSRNYPVPDWTEMAPMEVILAPWAVNKSQQLYQLMGNKLIIETEVDYERGITELMRDIDTMLIHASSPVIRTFQDAWINMIKDHYKEFKATDESAVWALRRLIKSSSILAYNEWYNTTQTIQLPDNKVFRMQPGTKAMRAIRKIAEAYQIPGFQDFCNLHSLILNQKHLQGTLCLSIHPLDYITMSDNSSNWSSCMSWKYEGAYKQGTIEMMNSPYVVIAYLKAKTDMVIGNAYTWNNKKWRELFIVSKDIIASVLGYPYQNDSLTQTILDILKELAEKNCGYKYHNDIFTRHIFFRNDQGQRPEKDFLFTTNLMYNDTKSEMRAYIAADHLLTSDTDNDYIINDMNLETNKIIINYSGPSECMFSGKTGVFTPGEEDLLYHIDKNDNKKKFCTCCGHILHRDSFSIVDGEAFCPNCYNKHVVQCMYCGAEHQKTGDNFVNIAILLLPVKEGHLEDSPDDIDDFINKKVGDKLYICRECFYREDIDRLFLKPGESWKFSSLDGETSIFWATVDMLNDEGLNMFYLHSNTMKSYAEWKQQLEADKVLLSSLLTN